MSLTCGQDFAIGPARIEGERDPSREACVATRVAADDCAGGARGAPRSSRNPLSVSPIALADASSAAASDPQKDSSMNEPAQSRLIDVPASRMTVATASPIFQLTSGHPGGAPIASAIAPSCS